MHAAQGPGQSELTRHVTQLPLPSHCIPSEQGAPASTLLAPHAPPSLHTALWQPPSSGAQSEVAVHATQLPLPSHFTPPLSEQAVPASAGVGGPHTPSTQAASSHAGAWQSAGIVQCAPASPPVPLPVELLLEGELLLVVPVVPAPLPVEDS
jgi:hypothetical protein